MKKVISASRRTDLIASFPEWLAGCLSEGRAVVHGPRAVGEVDLRPQAVHTLVLWSKNFRNLLDNTAGLRDLVGRYDQVFLHYTVTGWGGGPVEPGVPAPSEALARLEELVALAGDPRLVTVRFDPVVFIRDKGRILSNLGFFPRLAERVQAAGIKTIRVSFAQWYPKAARRAALRGIEFVDPPEEEKKDHARMLAAAAEGYGLELYSCAQSFLASVEGFRASSCIDGRLLGETHPAGEPASIAHDRTQRPECGCTVSADIGSYGQACPHGCVYCYANPETKEKDLGKRASGDLTWG